MSMLTSLHGLLHDHGLFTCLLHIYIVFYMVFLHGLFTWSFYIVFYMVFFYMVFLHGLFTWSFYMVFYAVFFHSLFHGLFTRSFFMVLSFFTGR